MSPSWFLWRHCWLSQVGTLQSFAHGDAREGMRQMAKEMREGHGTTTVVEAGRKGGRTVKEKYGPVFYSQIGKKGGRSIALERGAEYYSEIGKKGGEAVR